DGAAAALITRDAPNLAPKYTSTPKLLNFKTRCDYQTLDEMSFTLTDQGFRMYLSSYVPQILASNIEAFVDDLLRECHLQREDVYAWAIHPVSKKIVDFVQEQLCLPPKNVISSHAILVNYGN